MGGDIARLADSVDASDALLDPRGAPRKVVVDDDMRELEIDAFPASVGGDQHPSVRPELLLCITPLGDGHRSVDGDSADACTVEEVEQHLLRGDELGEDDGLRRRVSLSASDLAEQLEQVARLGVDARRHRLPSEINQKLDFGALVAPRRTLRIGERRLLLLPGEVAPFVDPVGKES